MPEPAPNAGASAHRLRTVLLRHDLPDGSGHWDWMIQRAPVPDSPLVTFRLDHRPDRDDIARFEATSLPDHRPEFLGYEGPVSRGRGRVHRVAQGLASLKFDRDHLVAQVDFGTGTIRFEGRRRAPDVWTFSRVTG